MNLLAFCLLQRFGRALPEVLRERIMDPIGASQSWEWHGYSTSWTEVGGKRVQSVSGGAHWGGGMFIARAIRRASACWWRAAAAGATGRCCPRAGSRRC